MTLDEKFNEAAEKVHTLAQRPTNDKLLKLYALYKQATEGDVTEERPGGFDFKGIAKYDSWASLRGMSMDTAKEGYINLVDSLFQ